MRRVWWCWFVGVLVAGCASPANPSNPRAPNAANLGAEDHAQQPSGYADPAAEGMAPTPPCPAPSSLAGGCPPTSCPTSNPPKEAPPASSFQDSENECEGGSCLVPSTRPAEASKPPAIPEVVPVEKPRETPKEAPAMVACGPTESDGVSAVVAFGAAVFFVILCLWASAAAERGA